jgi:hypothetical protein
MSNKKDASGLGTLGMVGAAMLFWFVTIAVSTHVLDRHPASAWLRGAMVALAVSGFSVWVVTVARLILSQDEFSQRIHLVAIALSTAVTAILVMAGDFLQTAGFLGFVPLQAVWLLMGGLWWLGIIAATRYYR